MKTWQYIKSKILKRRCQYDNGASVYLDLIITTRPLTAHIEVFQDGKIDVYEIDMSTITPNMRYSKIVAKGYYLHSKKGK